MFLRRRHGKFLSEDTQTADVDENAATATAAAAAQTKEDAAVAASGAAAAKNLVKLFEPSQCAVFGHVLNSHKDNKGANSGDGISAKCDATSAITGGNDGCVCTMQTPACESVQTGKYDEKWATFFVQETFLKQPPYGSVCK